MCSRRSGRRPTCASASAHMWAILLLLLVAGQADSASSSQKCTKGGIDTGNRTLGFVYKKINSTGAHVYDVREDREAALTQPCDLFMKIVGIAAPPDHSIILSINRTTIRDVFGRVGVEPEGPPNCVPVLTGEENRQIGVESRRRASLGDTAYLPALLLLEPQEQRTRDDQSLLYSTSCLICAHTQHRDFHFETALGNRIMMLQILLPNSVARSGTFRFHFNVKFVPKPKKYVSNCVFKCGASTKCITSEDKVCDGEAVCPNGDGDENPQFCKEWRKKVQRQPPTPPPSDAEIIPPRKTHERNGGFGSTGVQIGTVAGAMAVAAMIFVCIGLCYFRWHKRPRRKHEEKRQKADGRRSKRRKSKAPNQKIKDIDQHASFLQSNHSVVTAAYPHQTRCQRSIIDSRGPLHCHLTSHDHSFLDESLLLQSQYSACYSCSQTSTTQQSGQARTGLGLKTDFDLNLPYSVPHSDGEPRRGRLAPDSSSSSGTGAATECSVSSSTPPSTGPAAPQPPRSAVVPPPNRCIISSETDRRR